MAKAIADPAGHYSKPEATRLILNKTPLQSVVIEEVGNDRHELIELNSVNTEKEE